MRTRFKDLLDLPEGTIVVGDKTLVLFRVLGKGKPRIERIRGLIKEYKDRYSSVELQHKARDWWKDVPA